VADEFKEHADAEREHADQIAERISQLGGKPDFSPQTLLQRSASQYIEGETLADMIREDLIAERIVIEVYTEMIRYFADQDPTTRVMIEGILKDEEEHANDLADLLYVVDPRTGETEGQDPGTRPLSMHAEQNRRGGEQQQGRQQAERGQQQRGQEERSAGRAAELQPAHEPGTRGRTPRKGSDEAFAEEEQVRGGGESGSSHAVHVTNPNRKRKKIA